MSRPFFRDPAPFVTRWRSRTVAKGDSTRPQVLPVLGGEVEERQQRVGIMLQRRGGLRVLGPVLDGEPGDRLARLLAGLRVHHLVQHGLRARLETPGQLVEDVAELVDPIPLRAGLRPHVADSGPEPERTVAHGDDRGVHAPTLQVAQHGLPALRALAVTVLDRNQFLGSVRPDADHDQRAEAIVVEADVEVHAIDPDVNIVARLRFWKARYSVSHSAVSRVMFVAESPAASFPNNAASASRKSPVDRPRR